MKATDLLNANDGDDIDSSDVGLRAFQKAQE